MQPCQEAKEARIRNQESEVERESPATSEVSTQTTLGLTWPSKATTPAVGGVVAETLGRYDADTPLVFLKKQLLRPI